jgi:hypothetical protein
VRREDREALIRRSVEAWNADRLSKMAYFLDRETARTTAEAGK